MGSLAFKRAFALFFIMTSLLLASETLIIRNDAILPQKTVDKIDEIGKELRQKTGVSLYVAVVKKMDQKKIVDFEKSLAKDLKPPFILLALSVDDQKVDIYSSDDVRKRFNKEQILSPYPWEGSIIPILTAHFKNQKAAIEAAILNGYSEIAEQVAKSYGIKLKSAIGNTNRNIYYWLRILFYSIIALIFANFIYRRYIKR